MPRICDVGNFTSKMIVDGLMYAGSIGKDDNLKHVPSLSQEAYIDKENPRTEIYIIKYENQIQESLLPLNLSEKLMKKLVKKQVESVK